MKEEVSVSIIIPIYNTANYLDQCIHSAVDQIWQNIEVLLLDDGSTDGSVDICRRWANLDSRIRFFEEEHLGQGTQRNIGIRESKGDYILFLDSDNYLEPDAVETVVTYIAEKKAQICLFSYWNERVESEGIGEVAYRISHPIRFQGCTSVQETPEILGFCSPLLWDKCYEGSFLRSCGLTMSNLMCGDLLFLGQLLEKADRICTLDAYPYHYRFARENNFSKAYNRFYDVIEVIDSLNRYFKEIGKWDLYWKQLCRVSNTIIKDIIDRIRRGRIGNNEENKYFIEELKDCVKFWYGSHIDMEFYNNRFIVMGSATVRDIVLDVCTDAPVWFRDYTGNSIFHMIENMDKEPFGVDYVIMDLLEEVSAQSCYDDIDAMDLGNRLIMAFEKIKELNKDSTIRWVIIKNYYCETHGTYWDDVRTYKDVDRIREMNHKLDVLYEYVKEQISETMFVETNSYAEWRYSDLRQWGGSVPKVYNKVYIGRVSAEMNAILYQKHGMTGKDIKEQIMHIRPGVSKCYPLLAFFYQRTEGNVMNLRYFTDNNLNKIAIYGMGILGNALRREAERAGVKVVYAIDRMDKKIDGLSVFHMEEKSFPDANVIVVTPVQDYWDIVRRLEKKTDIPIVSLEDVVAYG